jgi:predicted DNA-binding protein with PD1-like motif
LKVETSERVRHLVLRAEPGDVLPDALVRVLKEHKVTAGWLRGSGVLTEIELGADRADLTGHGLLRRIPGPAQTLVLDGIVASVDGDVALALRVVFARETDQGVETLAGELTAARVVAFEVLLTALDDMSIPSISHGLDLRPPSPPRGMGTAAAAPQAWARAGLPAWSEAAAASASSPKDRIAATRAVPVRPTRPMVADDDGPFPKTGDIVEHFAFGTCEVIKSDGDRLHLRVGKDERMREIALEMLRVTLLSSDGESHRYRLDRKM